MIRLILMTVLGLSSAHAAPTENEIRLGRLAAYSSAVAQSSARVAELERGPMAKLQKSIEANEKRLANWNRALENAGPGAYNRDEAIKSRDELKQQTDDLRKKLADEERQLSEARKVLESNRQQQQAAATEVSENAELKARLDAMAVSQRIDAGKFRTLSADQIVSKIEGAMDRADTGIYLKDKIGKLMNSQLICESYNRCRAPADKKMPIGPEKLQEIFKDSSVPTRSDYYNQMRQQSSPSGGAQ